ncbi:MAG: ATP-binding protein [Bifidobacteriaceae bacterium]|jgi:hypothetical protein|nr:ATP-binding protein [Bifidobacteriaceae bacterium]
MDALKNPYSPGPGLAPPELAGRRDESSAFDTLLGRAANGLTSSPIMLTGLRGVGKTVLLQSFRERAAESKWLTMSIEAEPGPKSGDSSLVRLTRELETVSRQVKREGGRGTRFSAAVAAIESFSISLGLTGGGVSMSTRTHSPVAFDFEGELFAVVEALSAGLTKDKSGLALFIDEMQDFDDDVTSALVAVQHAASQRGWPFYLIGAGLPGLPRRLAAVRSYTERYAYWTIDRLTDDQSAAALTEPARRLGVRFEPAAAGLIVSEARGYPFFLQSFGYQAWLQGTDDRITEADAETAIQVGYRGLDGFFRARWDRATKAERAILRLIAASSPEPSTVTSLAARRGKPVSSLGPARRSLIEKGLVYVPERGRLALTSLGMAGFIERETAAGGDALADARETVIRDPASGFPTTRIGRPITAAQVARMIDEDE